MLVVKTYSEQIPTRLGFYVTEATFEVTGLAANGANTIPFPNILPKIPRRVFLQAVGNNAIGAVISLDDSQGAVGPAGSLGGGHMGFDSTNVFVFIGNITELVMTVDY